MGFANRLHSRLDRSRPADVYELHGVEILRGGGRRPGNRLRVKDVKLWHFQPETGFDVVTIELGDGTEMRWLDVHGDLISILRKVAPAAEGKE